MIWIEILSRQRQVQSRQRFDGGVIRVGRAYDNDIVLDDAHVAPHHLVIEPTGDGGYRARDLGSLNGLRLGAKGHDRVTAVSLGDQPILIGQTWLRLRRSDDPVAAELPVRDERTQWRAILLLAIPLFGIELASPWLRDFGEPKWINLVQPSLLIAAVAGLWAAIWAVLSRLFAGAAHFDRHLRIAFAVILGVSVLDEITTILGYNFGWQWPAIYSGLPSWCALMLAVFLNLRALGPARLWTKAAVCLGLAVVVIGMQAIRAAETREQFGGLPLSRRLLPSNLRFASLHSEAAVFEAIGGLKATLDLARAKRVSGDDGGDDPDE